MVLVLGLLATFPFVAAGLKTVYQVIPGRLHRLQHLHLDLLVRKSDT